jgi:hypothetical protein
MATKLTLRMDEKLIAKAKKYAKRSGKSVSQLVADFFALLGAAGEADEERLSPRVKELKGSLKGASIKEDDYRKHLEEKYL